MRRSSLEVLKFTSAADILQNASRVCSLWYQLSTDNELWYELLCEPCLPGLSPKESYRRSIHLQLAVLYSEPYRLHMYHCATKSYKEIPLLGRVRYSWNSAHAFLDEERILTCGYQPTKISSRAFIIYIATGRCEQIAGMTEPRVGHGVSVVNAVAYVFGGHGPKNTCESLGVTLTWRKIAHAMQCARAWFTPCFNQEWIYLCGGGSAVCERFNTHTDHFETLQFELPETYSSACSVYYRDCLVIVTNNEVCVCNTLSQVRAAAEYRLNVDAWCNSPAVVYNDTLLMPRNEDGLRTVKLSEILELATLRSVLN